MNRFIGVVSVLAVVILAMTFAAANVGHRATLSLGLFTLYRVPVTLVAFSGLLVGMLVMFATGVHSDLKVRRILRDRLAEETRKEQVWIDRNQRDLFAQEPETDRGPAFQADARLPFEADSGPPFEAASRPSFEVDSRPPHQADSRPPLEAEPGPVGPEPSGPRGESSPDPEPAQGLGEASNPLSVSFSSPLPSGPEWEGGETERKAAFEEEPSPEGPEQEPKTE